MRAVPHVAKRSSSDASDSLAASLASGTNLDSLVRTVEDLVAFGTRYEYTAEQESAAVYLFGRFEAMGYEPFYHEYTLSEWDLRGIEFSPGVSRGWIALSHDETGAVLVTEDGGQTWETEFLAPVRLYDVAAAGNWVRFAAGDSGRVFREEGGVWEAADTLGVKRLSAIDFLDSLRGIAASQSGAVYRTDDGGGTWIEQAVGSSPLNDAVYVDEENAWAAGASQQIWHWTPTGGWVLRNSGPGTIYDIAFAGPSLGAALLSSGNKALLWDGNAWNQASTPIPRGYTVAFAPDSALWIAGLDDPILLTRVFRAETGGESLLSWEEVLFPSFPFLARNIDFLAIRSGGGVVAGGVDGLFVSSDDGGASWSSIPLPEEVAHRSRNVGAEIPGRVNPDSVVILSAHYDSYAQPPMYDPYTDAPGADDDASGVAAVLETARLLSGAPAEKTIRFLLFSGEELGLQGSIAYATGRGSMGEAIAADVQIDMIGRSDGPLIVYADEPSSWLLDEIPGVRELSTPDLACSLLVAPEMIYSDHSPFWASGYPAVLVNEDFEVATHDLHTSNDTLGNFDFPFFEKSARLSAALTAKLAGVFTPIAPADSVASLPPYPNPSAGAVTIRFAPPASGPVSLRVYDVAGREIRSMEDADFTSSNGIAALAWDGRDRSGRRAAAGVYFVRVKTVEREITKKIVIVR
ncbi:MAG: M20/M25/M40 family metallo-hydrolase [Candidatus Eisenbacteria bacterium]